MGAGALAGDSSAKRSMDCLGGDFGTGAAGVTAAGTGVTTVKKEWL